MPRLFSSLLLMLLAMTCGGALAACDVLDTYVLSGRTDPDAGGAKSAPSGFAMYTTMDFEGEAAAAASKLGVRRMPIIYQHHIDPGDHGVLDAERLRAAVLREVPANWTGPAVLDWEGKWLARLAKPGTANHAKSVAQGVKALEVAKAARPNAQWGYYGLPFRRYWRRDEPIWNEQAEAMAPIIQASDILTPSIYDFYEDARDPKGEQWDRSYAAANVRHALEHSGGRDVYAFVWHRWHDSNKELRNQVIPDKEWAAHINAIATAEWNGRRAAGVLWWAGDDRAARQGKIDAWDQIPAGMSQQAYANRLLGHKAAVMAEGATGKPHVAATSPGNPYVGPAAKKK